MERERRASVLRRSPAFGRFLAADLISPLGDAMATVALILHLQQVEGTGTAVATVLVAESLPPLLSPWLGAIADRYAGRGLLVACNAAQAMVVAVMAVFLPGVAGLFVLVFVRAMFAAVYAPAAGAAVPDLVDDDDLPAANSLLGGARELGTVFGPALAGLLFAVDGGARAVLAVDAATFLLTLPLLASLPLAVRERTASETPARSVASDARAGMGHLWRAPRLRVLAIGFWLVVLATASDDLVLAFLGERDLGAGPFAIGVLLAAASVGLLLGLLAIARWGRRMQSLTAVLLGFAVMSMGNLLTAAAPILAAALATQVVRGVGTALIEANVRTFVQRQVPRALLGRVLANLYGGVYVAAALGYVAGGPLLDATSPRLMFVLIGGAGLAASAVATLLVRGQAKGGDRVGPLPHFVCCRCYGTVAARSRRSRRR